MSMYLSNTDVGPVGAEPGEFIDFPPTLDELRHAVNGPTLDGQRHQPGDPAIEGDAS